MSGEPRSGQYQGTRFTPVPIDGTAFQLSRVGEVVKIIPKDIKPTRMTERQLTKAVLNAAEVAEDRSRRDKYTFYAVAAGIAAFGKYKPKTYAVKPTESYRAKKNERLAGLRLFDSSGKPLNAITYSTLTEAKNAAKSYLSESQPKVYIDKTWTDRYGYIVKTITVHAAHLTRVGDMKSMPKVKPKSYLVIPEYLWAYDGVLCDYEYEFC